MCNDINKIEQVGIEMGYRAGIGLALSGDCGSGVAGNCQGAAAGTRLDFDTALAGDGSGGD